MMRLTNMGVAVALMACSVSKNTHSQQDGYTVPF
jgi:hypothetical protein